MEKQFTLKDGQVTVTFDNKTGEILLIEDWHGNDVYDQYFDQAENKVVDYLSINDWR